MHKNLQGKNGGKGKGKIKGMGRNGGKGGGNVIFSASHIGKKFELIEVLRDITFTVARKEGIGIS